jgi:hypothetical protein
VYALVSLEASCAGLVVGAATLQVCITDAFRPVLLIFKLFADSDGSAAEADAK